MKAVIDYINCQIKPLIKGAEVNGLVEIIKRPQIKDPSKFDLFPGKYFNNEYKKIEHGIYHRMIGKPKSSINEDSSFCGEEVYDRQYPMRMVAIIDKSKYKDDQYSDLSIADQLSLNIEFQNNKNLGIAINADLVYTTINSIDIDRDAVFKREFSGENFIDYNKTVIAIDYIIHITGDKQCLLLCDHGASVISIRSLTGLDYS